MEQGVRLADPARFDLRDDPRTGRAARLACGQDVEIDVGCIFSGHVEIGEGARIGAYCSIANATIAAGAVLHPYTHVDGEKAGVSVGEGALVGPFARLRPGAQLGREVHIGNFVEVKNSVLADGAKANHLAYLGDATVGERVNYGAGSITANYDGVNKHRTVIEADVHIGSNCVLVMCTSASITVRCLRPTCTSAATACWWRPSPLARAARWAAAPRSPRAPSPACSRYRGAGR